ncbi:MAG TPA: MtrB/PioB family outer membrane beta-barrel protein [Holophagaceae bacterium]|nr:MtrB/PioB family outer membrane beta-barrel protein [Holophagaceae bacterium]
MSTRRNLGTLALGVAFALVAAPARAQASGEPNTSGDISVGGQYGTGLDQSSKLQQYESIPKGLVIFGADFSWKGQEGYYLDFTSGQLSADDQWASLLWGKRDTFKLKIDWQQNPRWFSNTARTLYLQSSPGVFVLPDALQAYDQANFNATTNPQVLGQFAGGALPVDLKYIRKKGSVDYLYTGLEHWTFDFSYAQERRSGTKAETIASYFGNGANIYEVAAPVQYKTHDMKAEASFAKGRYFADASLSVSKFTNDVQTLRVDNPMRLTDSATDGPAVYQKALAPDNDAWNLHLVSGMSLPMRHKLTVDLSAGSMSMDTSLLPYTTNSVLNANPAFDAVLPYNSVKVQYDTLLAAVKLTGDPLPWMGYNVSIRDYELKDKTGDYQFPNYVAGDTTIEPGTVERDKQGYKKQTFRGEAHFTPLGPLRLGLAYSHEKNSYDVRAYESAKDDSITGTVDFNQSWVSVHASYTDLKRKPVDLNPDETPEPADSTQYDIWRRDSKLATVMVSFTPLDALAISLSGQQIKNDFPDSVYGLQSSKYDNYGLDVDYALGDRFTLIGAYIYETYDYDQASRYSTTLATTDPLNLWSNESKDKVDTFKFGFTWTIVPKRFDLSSDLDYSKGRNNSAFSVVPGGAAQGDAIFLGNQYLAFPEVANKTTIWKTQFNLHFNKNLTASLMYWWQKYDRADWATDQMQVYMASVDPATNRSLFLGARVPSYDAKIVRAFIRYTF